MLNHQLTANTIFANDVAAHASKWGAALSGGGGGRERKGSEEDGSDRRNKFHGRRGVDNFEVGWDILQSMQPSSFISSSGSVCSSDLLVNMTVFHASNRINASWWGLYSIRFKLKDVEFINGKYLPIYLHLDELNECGPI